MSTKEAKEMMPAEVSTPSDRSVLLKRNFNAPRQLVWRAYTEPALFARWCLGMPGWSMSVCEMDVCPGGSYRWRWRNEEEGGEFGFLGEFREVVPLSRLVHTQVYDTGNLSDSMGEESVVAIELTEHNGVTRVATTITFASEEDRDEALFTGMTVGMEMSYKQLENVLAE